MSFRPPSGGAYEQFSQLITSSKGRPIMPEVLRHFADALYMQGYRDGESLCHCTDCWLKRHQQQRCSSTTARPPRTASPAA